MTSNSHEIMHKTRPAEARPNPSMKKGGSMAPTLAKELVTSDKCREMERQFSLRVYSP